jgi:hypothetical protein
MVVYDVCDFWLRDHSRCQTETLEQVVGRKKDSPVQISFRVTTNLRSKWTLRWPKHQPKAPPPLSLWTLFPRRTAYCTVRPTAPYHCQKKS